MSIIHAHEVESITVGKIEQMAVSGTNVRSIFIESKQGTVRLHLFADDQNNLIVKEAEDDI